VEKVTDYLRWIVQGVLFWVLTVTGLALLALVLILPLVRQHQTMDIMVQQMQARNDKLNADATRLLSERDALLYDAFYVEKLARRDLNMTRKGEEQVSIIPATYDRYRVSAESHINTANPVGLWRLYGMLHVLAEDTLIRQVAVILGGLTVISAILLFGRAARPQRATV
jgi:cell division protein FtsB